MATQQTGLLDTDFLASTNVIPSKTTRAANRGNNDFKLWGRRNQRTWKRQAKGSVTYTVTSPGSPKNIRENSPKTL